jgi:hypothetical protein
MLPRLARDARWIIKERLLLLDHVFGNFLVDHDAHQPVWPDLSQAKDVHLQSLLH